MAALIMNSKEYTIYCHARSRRLGYLVMLGLTLCCAWPVAAMPFHAPQGDAEQALDAILKNDAIAAISSKTAYTDPMPDSHPAVLTFNAVMTQGLFDAIQQEERRLIDLNCDGNALGDEICGFDYNPITCTQDNEPHYTYRTLAMDGNITRIEYRWPKLGTIVAEYRMQRESGVWKIDGVKCAGPNGNRLHWPQEN